MNTVETKRMNLLQAINSALDTAMEADGKVVCLGEDGRGPRACQKRKPRHRGFVGRDWRSVQRLSTQRPIFTTVQLSALPLMLVVNVSPALWLRNCFARGEM